MVCLFRAVVVELKNSIKAGVTITGSSNDLVTGTNDLDPDTSLALVAALTVRVVLDGDGVILKTVWKRTTLYKVGFKALSMSVGGFLIQINMVITSRVVDIACSDEDVVSPAVLHIEADSSAVTVNITLSNAAHFVTVVINLKLDRKQVEGSLAGRCSEGLLITVVSVTIPATTTSSSGTITALFTSFDTGCVASEDIRNLIDFLGVPALSVGSLFIRHDRKREVNTVDGGRNRRNDDVVSVGGCKEHNCSTKTAIIIIGSNAIVTGTRVFGRVFGLTLRVNIDNGIVNGGRAGASSGNDLTVNTL